jgi:hypothetical protein
MKTDPNLGKRLASWAQQLRCNKSYPWVGTGLIDVLEEAALAQGAQLLTDPSKIRPVQQTTEYDL